ncbi:MAG TPA: hypothetical protein VF585_02260 [Chthoniobacterales bacterium]
MISSLAPTDYALLYRFAVALAGLNEDTEALVHEVLEEKLPRLSHPDPQKNLVQLLRALWLARPHPRGESPISNLPPQFQWMKTRQRAVTILQASRRFTEEEITAICDAGVEEETLPPEKIAAALDSIPVSPELLRRLAATVKGLHPPFRLLSPLGLALIFAGLVLCGVGYWIYSDWRGTADEKLAEKFLNAAKVSSSRQPEPVSGTVGELADALFLNYGLENYPIPASFASASASTLAVSHVDGYPVVQIGLKDSPALLMLFRAEDFGLAADDANWQMASIDGWSLAVRSENNQGHVITVEGPEEKLRALLPP